MLETNAARDKVAALVEKARRAGADAADAVYVGDRSQSVSIRLGALEDVNRSEGEEIGLRLFVGKRSASVASSDLSDDALSALVERAAAMAREAPEDAFAGLAPEDMLFRGTPVDLDLDDGCDPDPATLRERAAEAEDAARAVPGVTNSNGGSASASASTFAIATSHGFAAATRATGYGNSASVVAGEGSGMQRDYSFHSARHLADLEPAADIGRRAAERAVARLNPVRPTPGAMAVLFDPRVATSLLGHLIGAINGSSIARKSSFLLDALGTQVFGDGVSILDDPLRPRGLRSRSFDGEGLPVAPSAIIDKGTLTGWLADSAAARQLGIAPTGHAVRGVSGAPGAGPSNLHLAAGKRSPEEMIAGISSGVLVTELIGQGVNGVTGDYSRGAAGFMILNGEIGPAVSEITIASNLKDMFATLEPASDLRFRRGVDSPTVLVPSMTVASA
ncbi:metallopeptidase TldD-related protein [Sphingomonas sp. LY29]|uniref:TldD/PmbA family protein n=1 Tax=Sphingomonas sp. LY29 TaxID=3095341 RepID=UPI002D790AC2|nr:metallopeptidase TldD-related protein [Sphingomonas sp. LY29]WRP25340.1 metallopeptidase TldD-related protein [Sphingomonas sp. LY29]